MWRGKVYLFLALLLLLAGFGAAVMQGTYAEQAVVNKGPVPGDAPFSLEKHIGLDEIIKKLSDKDDPFFGIVPEFNYIYGVNWEENA